MRVVRIVLVVAATLFLAVPSMADAIVDSNDGREILTGFARIDTGGCRVRWDKPAQEYQVKGCETLAFRSTTDSDLILGASTQNTTLNATVNAMKANNTWTYQANDPDLMSGCWGITVNYHFGGDLTDFLGGGGIRRDNCVFHAQPMSLVGSAYVANNEQNMTAVIGQASNGRDIRIDFYKDNPPIGKFGTPSQGDNRCVQIPPKQIALSWSCVSAD